MIKIKEYLAKRKERKSKRFSKQKELILSGQISYMPWRYWRDKLDEIAKLYAKLKGRRYGFLREDGVYVQPGKCRICATAEGTVAYHIIECGRLSTAFLEENIVLACKPCNYGEFINRRLYRQKHIEIFGKEFYEWLERRSKDIWKRSAYELRNLVKDYEEKISAL